MRARMWIALAAVLVASCGDDAAEETTSTGAETTTTEAVTPTAGETTTTAPATTTTAAPTTTTTAAPTTTTTAAPTTTTAQPPSQVTGLTVGLAGGSEEVAVTWEPNPGSDDVKWYNAYFSEMPGGSKSYVTSVGPDEMIGFKVGFIDWPRHLTDGQTCYIVRAVNDAGEGPASAEACFDHTA
jgi:hypothetical protein